jgi:hypothetical protein
VKKRNLKEKEERERAYIDDFEEILASEHRIEHAAQRPPVHGTLALKGRGHQHALFGGPKSASRGR